MDDKTKVCPHCSVEMKSEGQVAIPRVLKTLGMERLPKWLWEHILATAFRCPECGYIMLFGSPDRKEEQQSQPSGSDIKVCPHCGARNFRRQVCHKCGCELPDKEKDDRFDYSDKFK